MQRQNSDRNGTSAVEFAVVAPVFFLLIFGMVEYGRMVMVQQVVTNSAREGARVAILDNTTSSDVLTAANRYLTAGNISNARITMTPATPSSGAPGSQVTVKVEVDFRDVSWLPVPLYLGNTTITYTAAMRREAMP